MNLRDLTRILREQWLVVVACVVLGLVGAVGASFLRAPTYTSVITLFVSAQSGDNNSSAYQGSQLSEQRVKSYTSLVNSPRVMAEVVSGLGLPGTADGLSSQVRASSALDSVLIDVAVTEADPRAAASIANEVAKVFSSLVDELEAPTSPNGVQAVAVRIVAPASIPVNPSSTGLLTLLALGGLGGLGVGVAGAFGRNALDATVRSPDQLGAISGAPVIGTIAFDRKLPDQPLAVREDPQSALAESFRQLRTNLQFVDIDNPRRAMVVTSSLPGEGKTTTVVNLAMALGAAGNRVVVVEADLRRPRITDIMGLERAVGLTSVLTGRTLLTAALQQWVAGGIDVLASGTLPPNPSELLGSENMRRLVDELRKRYDMVLIDTPPLLPVTDAAALAPATDGAIVVCRFGKTTRTQAENTAKAIRAVSVPVLGTILTMTPAKGPRAYSQYNSYYRTTLPEAPESPAVGFSPAPPYDDAVEATLQQPARPRPQPQPRPRPQPQESGFQPRPQPPGPRS